MCRRQAAHPPHLGHASWCEAPWGPGCCCTNFGGGEGGVNERTAPNSSIWGCKKKQGVWKQIRMARVIYPSAPMRNLGGEP